MFVLRAAFWLSLVVFLIPGDPQSGRPAPSQSAIETIIAARNAISSIAGLCTSQPDLCASGSNALAELGAKAKLGATLFLTAVDHTPTGEPAAAPGTLRPEDVNPTWRGPSHDNNV